MNRKRRGRSEGSIFKRADGQWAASVSLGYTKEGKRRRRVVYGASKKEVLDELKKLDPNKVVEGEKHTVESWLNRWLEHSAKPKVAGQTHQRYEQLVRLYLLPHLGTIRLAQLRDEDVEDFYAKLTAAGVSNWIAKMCGALLANALRPAVKRGWLNRNPAAEVAKPRPAEEELAILTDEEVRKFLAAVRGNHLEAIFVLAVGSGMRQGELLALRWGDVDFDKNLVHVRRSLAIVKGQFVEKEPKSKRSRRSVALPGVVMDALREHLKKMMAEGNTAAPVFCTRTGNHIAESNFVRKTFTPQLKKSGVRHVRFHSLRHFHATSLIAKGYSIKAVSQRLGHATIEITLRVYGHVIPGDDAMLAGGMQEILTKTEIGYSCHVPVVVNL